MSASLGALAALGAAGSAGARGECWRPPVEAAVADPFRAPECPWCAGNRGIEYQPTPGRPVTSVQAGTVTFSGDVAGVRYVVVEHADGLRATYGRLATASQSVGTRLPAGATVGVAGSGTTYFGLRLGDEYVDPTPFLGVVEPRPRLVPIDGTPPRPPPAPRLTCPSGR